MKVQAQHLQPGDKVGSGETIIRRPWNGVRTPVGKVQIELLNKDGVTKRYAVWGKYTQINIERNS